MGDFGHCQVKVRTFQAQFDLNFRRSVLCNLKSFSFKFYDMQFLSLKTWFLKSLTFQESTFMYCQNRKSITWRIENSIFSVRIFYSDSANKYRCHDQVLLLCFPLTPSDAFTNHALPLLEASTSTGPFSAFPFIILWKYAKLEKASINQSVHFRKVNFIQETWKITF